MIIKKKNKSNNLNPKTSGKKKPSEAITPKMPETSEFQQSIIRERQERRRGDRRRGYRRIEDRTLISRAQEEANAIKESATGEGFEHGIKISQKEIQKLTEAINELLTAKERVMKTSIPDIALLAVKAAEKIIKKELEIDDTIILNVVTEVLQSISKDETEITIKTNPNDTEIVRENLPKIYHYNENSTKITVITEESVDWGSCIVETKNGVVDARFSTQLQILQKALEAKL